MSTGRKILQALAGLILAGADALAAGTWVFPQERDLIASFAGLRLSVSGLGAGLSLLTVLAFADGWIGARNRKDPGGRGAGRVGNGIGFGLLPGILVWKIFERHTLLGRGTPAAAEFGGEGWLISGGAWLPGRIEIMTAGILFAAVILWLALRKEELPDNGDLAGVCVGIWCGARMVTESFRAEQIVPAGGTRIIGWLAAAVMAVILFRWILRAFRQKRNTGYALACVPVFAISVAGIVLIQNGIIGTGIPAADLAGQICCALMAVKALICMGRVTRAAGPAR